MSGDRDVVAVYDERVLAHDPDADAPFLPSRLDRRVRHILSELRVKWAYPEHPGRLRAVIGLLEAEPLDGVRRVSGTAATRAQLARVHTTAYLEQIEALRGQHAWLDTDTTAVSPGSVEAAEVAAGSAIVAVDQLFTGEADAAFALVRPPGHHAEPVRARGFCLFNNVAVAAAHAKAVHGCERVLIVDWDAHHGNGTQDIFWADPEVLFFDTHVAAPFYPGSGLINEVGGGLGEGYTVNVPLPEGAGDSAIIKAFREILIPAADWYQPDLVLVSAGYDPHRLDLAMHVSYAGFAMLTQIVREIADRHCDGRLAMVLEGGYNLESLSRGVHTSLAVLTGAEAPEPLPFGAEAVEDARDFHLDAFRDD